MNMQTCPKCGEENPDEAVMCWACYTALSDVDRATTINIAQALRWLPTIGGGVLILYGLARRSRSGLGCALLGSGLIYLSTKQHRSKSADTEDEAPIVRIVNTILKYAIKNKASEIHIEPEAKGVLIRYRMGDVLRDQMKVPKYVLQPVAQRIKVMSDHGCIRLKMLDKQYSLHVHSSSTEFGEKVVMSFEEEIKSPENQVIWEIPDTL